MSTRKSLIFVLILTIVAIGACSFSHIQSRPIEGYSLNTYDNFYVVVPKDSDGVIPNLILEEMKRQRFNVDKGPIEEIPPEADAIVYYRDHWCWDITSYMISISIDVRESKSNLLVATGVSSHSSLDRKKPVEMVREAMSFIYETK